MPSTRGFAYRDFPIYFKIQEHVLKGQLFSAQWRPLQLWELRNGTHAAKGRNKLDKATFQLYKPNAFDQVFCALLGDYEGA